MKSSYSHAYTAETSLVAQMVKHLPTMQETQVQSLVREDPLEKEWQPTPILLPGKSHGHSPQGSKELDTTEQLHFHFSLSYSWGIFFSISFPYSWYKIGLFHVHEHFMFHETWWERVKSATSHLYYLFPSPVNCMNLGKLCWASISSILIWGH